MFHSKRTEIADYQTQWQPTLHTTQQMQGLQATFLLDVHAVDTSYLVEHRVQGATVLPGAYYVDIALAVAMSVLGHSPCVMRQIYFPHVLLLDEQTPKALHCRLKLLSDTECQVTCYTLPPGAGDQVQNRTVHAQLRLPVADPWTLLPILSSASLTDLRKRLSLELAGEDFYTQIEDKGNDYGPTFQGVAHIWQGKSEALARIELPKQVVHSLHAVRLHPAFLDACLHPLAAVGEGASRPFILKSIEQIRVFHPATPSCWSHAQLIQPVTSSQDLYRGDVRVCAHDGRLLLELIGLQFHYLEPVHRANPAHSHIAHRTPPSAVAA